MKAAVAFLVVFLALVADAANKKHKAKNLKYEDIGDSEEDGGGEWPQPEAVRSFGVPDVFTASSSFDVNIEDTTSGKHHGKQHHKKLTTHHQ